MVGKKWEWLTPNFLGQIIPPRIALMKVFILSPLLSLLCLHFPSVLPSYRNTLAKYFLTTILCKLDVLYLNITNMRWVILIQYCNNLNPNLQHACTVVCFPHRGTKQQNEKKLGKAKEKKLKVHIIGAFKSIL